MSEQVALVTGAARGIGLAISQRILAEGWRADQLDLDGATLFRAMDTSAQGGCAPELQQTATGPCDHPLPPAELSGTHRTGPLLLRS